MGRLSWLAVALGTLAAFTAPAAEARRLLLPGSYAGLRQAYAHQAPGGRQLTRATECARPHKRRGRKEGGWKKGKMTFYWGSEEDVGYGSGAVGGCDNPLEAHKSVAVPQRRWDELKGRTVAIEGTCDDCVVDDMCAGPDCADFDLYVGWKNDGGYDGRKDIRYKLKERVDGHPCVSAD